MRTHTIEMPTAMCGGGGRHLSVLQRSVAYVRAVSESGTPVEWEPVDGAVGVGKEHLLSQ